MIWNAIKFLMSRELTLSISYDNGINVCSFEKRGVPHKAMSRNIELDVALLDAMMAASELFGIADYDKQFKEWKYLYCDTSKED